MEVPWESHGSPMGVSRGNTLVPREFHGENIVPWTHHESPMLCWLVGGNPDRLGKFSGCPRFKVMRILCAHQHFRILTAEPAGLYESFFSIYLRAAISTVPDPSESGRVDMLTSPVAAARAVTATGAWVKSKHDM